MKKSLSQKQIEFAGMVARLLICAETLGIPVKVIEWHRNRTRQRKLYDLGRSRTLDSKHLIGLAVDLAIIRHKRYITNWKDYEPLGQLWELLGGVWGGHWKMKDGVHFEYKE